MCAKVRGCGKTVQQPCAMQRVGCDRGCQQQRNETMPVAISLLVYNLPIVKRRGCATTQLFVPEVRNGKVIARLPLDGFAQGWIGWPAVQDWIYTLPNCNFFSFIKKGVTLWNIFIAQVARVCEGFHYS